MIRSQLPRGPVSGLAFLPTGELIAVTPLGLFRGGHGNWHLVAPEVGAGRVAVHPGGRLVAAVMTDTSGPSYFLIADLDTGGVRRLDHAWNVATERVRVSFTPDGEEFRGRYYTTLRWSVPGWRMLDSLPGRVEEYRVWSPLGHSFHGEDSYVHRWSLYAPDGSLSRSEMWKSRFVTAAVFSPDSRRLYLAVKSRVRRLDADTGTELAPRNWGLSRVTALAISGDGLTAAMGTHLGEVVVWDEC